MKERALSQIREGGTTRHYEDARTTQATRAVFLGAENLINQVEGDIQSLTTIESEMCINPHDYSPIEHLTVKAAISRLRVLSLPEPTHLELVVPMYHEKVRMSPRLGSDGELYKNSLTPDPNGEDSLLRKFAELEWLTRGSNLSYRLIFVDDMCDQNSGDYAKQLIEENELSNSAVLSLGEAVLTAKENTLQYYAIETIIEDGKSIRGGALCLGFADAVTYLEQMNFEGQSVIGYVDADSSYSLAQVGIPLWQITNSPAQALVASRQHNLTYLEPPKSESQTSHRSPGLIRLKQTVGYLRKNIIGTQVPADTQSGFKLLKPEAVEATLRQPNKAHNFSYDTQLLARVSMLYPYEGAIDTFGVVCLDCDELSTANNGKTYFYALQIIQTIAQEMNFSEETDDMWLLNFLTRDIENYSLTKQLLEDNSDISDWFKEDSEESQLLAQIRLKIMTDRDTTAVGDYFTPDILESLVYILKRIEARQREEVAL